jgi:hypothetical protein
MISESMAICYHEKVNQYPLQAFFPTHETETSVQDLFSILIGAVFSSTFFFSLLFFLLFVFWGLVRSGTCCLSKGLSIATGQIMAEFERDQWLFSRETLVNSPSRSDGMDWDVEKKYRRITCLFIMELGLLLQRFVATNLSKYS